MPRGDTRIPAPFAIWTVAVLDQNRIRLPLAEIHAAVKWVTPESTTVECVAVPGPAGGVQLKPSATHERERDGLLAVLDDKLPESSDASQDWVDAARLLATSWRVVISVEKSRITITLPEPIRRGGLLPEVSGCVVVFGFGEILEIWEAGKWHEHARELARRRGSVLSKASEILAES